MSAVPGAHDPWYVYVMQNKANPKCVYTGATNNPAKRQRQHKGEISGGANTTTRWGPGNAEMVILIGPFPDTGSVASKIAALSFEKKMKVAKVGAGISGRVRTLMTLLNTPGKHVTKNVNLNKYALRVATRMTRSDFCSCIQKADHATIAYSHLFTYEAILAAPKEAPKKTQQQQQQSIENFF